MADLITAPTDAHVDGRIHTGGDDDALLVAHDLAGRPVATRPHAGVHGLQGWWLSHLRGTRPQSLVESRGALRVGDLFCGVGGLSLGVREAADELGYDFQSSLAVDIDADGLEVYADNFNTTTTVNASTSALVDFRIRHRRGVASFLYRPSIVDEQVERHVGELDLLVAGPPCQGHSNLNNHSRRDDARNDLYLTVPAMAVAMDVPLVIIENVPEVTSASSNVVATTISLLESAGYGVDAKVVAAHKLGWPQRRRRFFLVASRERKPTPLADIQARFLRESPLALASVLLSDRDQYPEHMLRAAEMSDENVQRIQWLFDNDAYDLANHMRPPSHRNGTSYTSVYGRLNPTEPAGTITTGFMTMGRGRYVHPFEPRMLNPGEAARLQGFPSTHRFEVRGDAPHSRQLSKWIGNAVPMPLGHAAALSLLG